MIKTRRKSIRDDINESWLTEKQTRDIELNVLLKMLNLNFSVDLIDDLTELYFFAFVSDVSTRIFLLIWSMFATTMYSCSKERDEKQFLIFCWIFNSDVSSIAIRRYCEIFAVRLTEEQNRNVELNELIKTADLNDLNRLIDDLIELYSLASVSDVSTRIFLILWSTSAATIYLDFDESIETRVLIFNLINDVKFVSNAICEILASWLIEKQTRDVELNLLLKMLNLNFCWISKLDVSSIAICWCCEIFVIWLIEKQTRNIELKQLMKILNLIDLIDVEFD